MTMTDFEIGMGEFGQNTELQLQAEFHVWFGLRK